MAGFSTQPMKSLQKKKRSLTLAAFTAETLLLSGQDTLLMALTRILKERKSGYTGTVVIPPEKAFGPSDPKLVETVSITKLQDRNVHPGMPVELDGRRGVVSRVIGRRVTVDFNSPLAGKTVTYEYTIEKLLED